MTIVSTGRAIWRQDRGRSYNCALCQMYEDDCTGCPVCEDTGKHSCDGTPYIEWAYVCSDHPKTADTPERKEVAEKMRDYLISLVPRVESGEL